MKKENKRHVCDLCVRSFHNSSNLNRHKKQFHSQTNNITIVNEVIEEIVDPSSDSVQLQTVALLSFDEAEQLIVTQHVSNVIPEPLIKCEVCFKSFSIRSSLNRHYRKFHPEKGGPTAKCVLCNKYFVSEKSLHRHCKLYHIEENTDPSKPITYVPRILRLECAVCGHIFSHKSNLKRHLQVVHPETMPPRDQTNPHKYHLCDICFGTFYDKSSLNRHRRTVCQDPSDLTTPQYECYHCSGRFFTKLLLRKHIFQSHILGDKKRKPMCDQCGQYFHNSSNLNRHKNKRHPPVGTPVCTPVTFVSPPINTQCEECGKYFHNASNLYRHQRLGHKEKQHCELTIQAYCDECDHYFHDRSTLNRHKKKIHGVEVPIITKIKKEEPEFPAQEFCELCERYFLCKNSLKRHKIFFHDIKDSEEVLVQPAPRYDCSFCHEKFFKKNLLWAHVRKNHPVTYQEKQLLEARLCELCGQSFANKSCMLRHKRTIHRAQLDQESSPEEEFELFECDTCHRKFRRKDSLVAHLRAKHPFENDNSNLFECSECSKKFTRKHAIRRHLLTIHAANDVKTANFKCTQCGRFFRLRHIARTHYEREHGIKMQVEKLRFNSMDQFEEWRTDVQRRYVTQFVRSYYSKTSSYLVTRYVCHRSGMYKDHSKCAPRKRSLKEAGSKKIQGYCPAEIILQMKADGYHVQFQSVHVGHPIATAEELRYIFLDKEQKRLVAERLVQGMSRDELLRGMRVSDVPPENLGRLSLLNFKDVDNIARTFGIRTRRRTRSISEEGSGEGAPIKKRRCRSTSRGVRRLSNVEMAAASGGGDGSVAETLHDASLVEKTSSVGPRSDRRSIEARPLRSTETLIFCKYAGEEDTVFRMLDKDDYVFVLMDEKQAEALQRYGHKVVAFDCRCERRSDFRFPLHTMFVLDVNGDGVPVAFLLTNRDDQIVIDIFVRSLLVRVGTVAPQTLITNMQTTFYGSWVAFMEPPQFHLFCSAYVNEVWRQFANKIADKGKSARVLQQLTDAERELDEVLFEQKLNAFMSDWESDDQLRNFMENFRSIFYENTKHWAYCYRKFAGVNTNALTDDFYRTMRENVTAGQTITNLSDGLRSLEEYLWMKGEDTDKWEEWSRRANANRAESLRKVHQSAAEYCADYVVSIVHIDSHTWQMVSFLQLSDNVTEIYTIEKTEPKECSLYDDVTCELLCNECGICSHEYRCTCLESCIQSKMCKHVHVLGFYQQTHKLLELKEEDAGEYGAAEVENLIEVTIPSPSSYVQISDVVADARNINEETEFCIKEVIPDDVYVADEISNDEAVQEESVDVEHFEDVGEEILEEFKFALSSAKGVLDLEEIRTHAVHPVKEIRS